MSQNKSGPQHTSDRIQQQAAANHSSSELIRETFLTYILYPPFLLNHDWAHCITMVLYIVTELTQYLNPQPL